VQTILTKTKEMSIFPIIRGDIKWSLTFGNDFSTSAMPNGVEKANYISTALKVITLDFSVSDIEIDFVEPTNLTELTSSIALIARETGITDTLEAMMPEALKKDLQSIQQQIININSEISQGLTMAKNLQQSIYGNKNNNKDSVNTFLEMLSQSITNQDIINIHINGRLYTNFLLVKPSEIMGSSSYTNNIAHCKLTFKEIDMINRI
jgi:hypothetical protein